MSGPVVYRYPVVAFDLDGTLLRGSSVSLLLADWLGHGEQVCELERSFHAGEISNSVVAEVQAAWLRGRRKAEVWEVLAGGPWIDGLDSTLAALRGDSVHVLLATITWSFAAQMLSDRHGFAAFSGTEMHSQGDVLLGTIARHFDERDKLCFVRDWCGSRGYSMSEVAAIGDSRSDVPLFGQDRTERDSRGQGRRHSFPGQRTPHRCIGSAVSLIHRSPNGSASHSSAPVSGLLDYPGSAP